jgi:hypothetical protein
MRIAYYSPLPVFEPNEKHFGELWAAPKVRFSDCSVGALGEKAEGKGAMRGNLTFFGCLNAPFFFMFQNEINY